MSITETRDYQHYVMPQVDYQRIEAALSQGGGLLRIRAPQKFGKTSFLHYVFQRFQQAGDRRIVLDLRKVDVTLFATPEKFLRALCLFVTRSLGATSTLDDYWDEDLGAKLNCSFYFEEYLLEIIEGDRLILVIENLDCLFGYGNTAREVLPLFRSWYEEARRTPAWSKLNLVVTYATEIYITLNVQQSPFNVGLPITLRGFNAAEITELAHRYGLSWTTKTAQYISEMLGGHPHLISLTLEHFSRQINRTLESDHQNWQETIQNYFEAVLHRESIYRAHFSRLWQIFSRYPELFGALCQLVNAVEPVQLPAIIAYKLEYLGLVERDGSRVTLCGELYRNYFQAQITELEQLTTNRSVANLQASLDRERLQKLEKENFELRSLAERDALTQLYNRRSFDAIFEARWHMAQTNDQALVLLVCDIDFFKQCNDTYGHTTGDYVLVQVAQVLLQIKSDFFDCVARYGGEEFVLLRLVQDPAEAIALGEKIRLKVAALDLTVVNNELLSPPLKLTMSVGGALWRPKVGEERQMLFQKADEMLYQAKQAGRNRVCWHIEEMAAIASSFD
ncbi:hypothetical protein NIES208_04870 [[Limnothrix rosea] IAM M-220]|nr:hypothetical protein NIES208_04870 [[Limnothrix rosea] IAM M-220]